MTTVPVVDGSDGPSNRFAIPGTDLYKFKKKPNPQSLEHYKNIYPTIEAEIGKVLDLDAESAHGLVSIRALIIGTSEATATLHIHVFCPPDIESAIKDIFALDIVQALLNHSRYSQPLGWYVQRDPPLEANTISDIDVCCLESYTKRYKTFCGAPTILRKGRDAFDDIRALRATAGGIVKVGYGDGSYRFHVMIAGHTIHRLQHNDAQLDDQRTGSELGKLQASEIAAWIPGNNALGQPLDSRKLPGVTAGRVRPSHDWALIEARDAYRNRAIHVPDYPDDQTASENDSHDVLIAEKPCFHDGLSDTILLLGAAGGSRRGELSDLPARIWLPGSKRFVDAYMLETETNTVRPGDSGGWVVHSTGPELYGHVVATDATGDAYVLPALDTFENIRQCLGATSVTLPSYDDIVQAERQGYWNTPIHETESGPSLPSDHRSFSHRCTPLDWRSDGSTTEVEFSIDTRHPFRFRKKKWNQTEQANRCPNSDIGKFSLSEGTKRYKGIDMLRQISRHSRIPSIEAKTILQLVADEVPGLNEHSEHENEKSYASSPLPESSRRVIYISDPDPKAIFSLIETATFPNASVLQGFIYRYLSQAAGIRVRVTNGFALEFHLPYFALRSGQALECSTDTEVYGQKDSVDISFFQAHKGSSPGSLFERQASIVFSGCHDKSWTAYSFGHKNLREELAEFQDEAFADDEWESDDGANTRKKFYSTTPASELSLDGSTKDEFPWDPRVYFLRAVQGRTGIALREWTYLILEIEGRARDWKKREHGQLPQILDEPGDIVSLLGWETKLLRLLSQLQAQLTSILQVWNRFIDFQNGDICYFLDIQNTVADTALNKIKEDFEELAHLGERLQLFKTSCEERCKTLGLQLDGSSHLESNEWSRQTHALNFQTNTISREIHELNRRTTDAALENLKVAHEVSKSTRKNVLLLWIITPLIIALQYFGSERDIFSFDRNARTFVVAVLVIAFALPILTFLCSFLVETISKSPLGLLLGTNRRRPMPRYSHNVEQNI